jgi:PEGA domain-containing protein
MTRWTSRLTFAALLSAALFLTPGALAQTRGDGQPRTGQAQPRSGRTADDGNARTDQDKKQEDKKQEDKKRAEARRRDDERRRAEDRARRDAPHSNHVVFVGGYFYDPFYGPFPWWTRAAYPIHFPIGDGRANIRVQVAPKSAAVYVDGFYAGIVDDFDGFFQALPVLPGGHVVALYLEGYQTVSRSIYLPPGSTFQLREQLLPVESAVASALPTLAPPVPEPPIGSYLPPRTPPRNQPPPPAVRAEMTARGFGTLSLRVQPANAVVTVDGDEWLTAKEGVLVVELSVGQHSLSVSAPGRTKFSSTVEIRESETTELNVSVPSAPRGTR